MAPGSATGTCCRCSPRRSLTPRGAQRWVAAFFLASCLATAQRGVGGAGLLPVEEAPLHTEGRYIVSRGGERVKWACANWYGAYSSKGVVGGLEVRPLAEIVARIAHLGFNCVRLCYSTQAHVENPVILRDAVEANLEFQGKRYLEVLDATVAAITQAGLMVIINNHNHKSGWCCHYTQDEGLWYTPEYPESVWIDSLVQMTLRYKSNPLVVAIDLRNEVHDYQDTVLTWGTGDMKTDWAAAATRAGNAVLAANPNVLIVIMALCFGMDLRAARDYPISLTVPDRVVYQTHNYVEFQFWMWISTTVTSWVSIRDFSVAVWILALVFAVVLLLAWDGLHRPKPALNTLLVYAGIWFFAILALSAVIAFAMYSVTRPYCGYWARRDMLPAVLACGLLSPVGLAMIVGGCVRHRRGCGACRTVAPKDEGGSEETSSSAPAEETGADIESFGVAGATPLGNPTPAASPEERSPTLLASQGRTAVTETVVGKKGDQTGSRGIQELQGASTGNIEAAEPQPEVRRAVAPKRLMGAPGWRSCGLAWSGLLHKVQKRKNGTKAELEVEWDMGLCCGFHCFVLAMILLLALGVLFIFACFAPTYQLLETHFDRMWGFVQEEGYPYTAPVWMGEFGNPVRGTYWINFMRYLRDHDMDFAYWALNGKKWGEGWIDTTNGKWNAYDEPRWQNESFGIFKEDYSTVRDAWRLLDLQALMAPPVDQFRVMQPCDRAVLGSQCGG